MMRNPFASTVTATPTAATSNEPTVIVWNPHSHTVALIHEGEVTRATHEPEGNDSVIAFLEDKVNEGFHANKPLNWHQGAELAKWSGNGYHQISRVEGGKHVSGELSALFPEEDINGLIEVLGAGFWKADRRQPHTLVFQAQQPDITEDVDPVDAYYARQQELKAREAARGMPGINGSRARRLM